MTPADAQLLAKDDAAFALDLYRSVRAQPGNVVFAPASLSLALAMTYAGAAGDTATEMASALHFTLPAERLHPAFDALDLALESRDQGGGDFRLNLANALWAAPRQPLASAFLDVLAVDYGAGVRRVDFLSPVQAEATINAWVSEKTHGHVPTLLQGDLDPRTELVLTNAVWFQASWTKPLTREPATSLFHAPGGDVETAMMIGDSASVWAGTGYRAASLAYAGNAMSFVVVVPDAGTFDAFEAAFGPEALNAVLTTDAATATTGGLRLPPFAFGIRLELKEALQALGMKAAFDAGLADFSGIDGTRYLFIQHVVHQATIAVNEMGTEAAAASAVVLGRKGGLISLTVDRPFLFFIRDDATGALLFAGRVLSPSVEP